MSSRADVRVQVRKFASLGGQVAVGLLHSYVSGMLLTHLHCVRFLHFGRLLLDETISLLNLLDDLADVTVSFLDMFLGTSFVRFLRTGDIFDGCAYGLHLCE